MSSQDNNQRYSFHEIANNNDSDNFSDVFSSSDISDSSPPSMPSFPFCSPPDRGIRSCHSQPLSCNLVFPLEAAIRSCSNETASQANKITNNNDSDNFSDVFSSSDISNSSPPSIPSFPFCSPPDRGILSCHSQPLSCNLVFPSKATNSSTDRGIRRCRSLVSSSWNERFQELIQFREANEHCFVPHTYPDSPKLSQWVRKQRHQRKRKERGLHSTLNDERQEMLTNAGFIWDSHQAQWQERYQSLEVFQVTHGHCNVPSNYRDSSLWNWVKNQRRQYRFYIAEKKTTMNEERVNLLNSCVFNWNPSNLGSISIRNKKDTRRKIHIS
jgi:hypothetical protein